MGLSGRRISVHLSVVIVSLLVAVSIAVATAQYLQNSSQRVAAAEQAFHSAEFAMSSRIADILGPAEVAVDLLADGRLAQASTLDERLAGRRILARVLDANASYASAYFGYPDGDFLLLRRLEGEAGRERFDAPDGARYLVQAIVRPATGLYVFYDADLFEIGRREEPDYVAYDPRVRPWYIGARRSVGPARTAPYIFFTTREVGTTVAMVGRNGAVAGIDVTLSALSALIRELQPVAGADIGLVDAQGLLIAHADSRRLAVPHPSKSGELLVSDLHSPVNRVLELAVRAAADRPGELVTFRSDGGETYRGMVAPLSVLDGSDYRLILAVPQRDLLAEARAAAWRSAWIVGLLLLVAAIVAIGVARRIARPLVRLAEDVRSIRHFDFEGADLPVSHIREIDELADAIGSMKQTIRRFLDITAAIAAERDLDRLLDRLLDEMLASTSTSGGVLYLASDDGTTLVPHAARLAGGRPAVCPTLPIETGRTDLLLVRATADALAMRSPATPEEIDRTGLRALCEAMPVPPRHLLATPLFNRGKDLVGVLLLIKVDEMDEALVRFAEQLSASAAVAVETRQLIAAQRQLFESFLQLIAQAIDAKSPYTGGHCARVPALTKMLAEAAHADRDGPFRDFALDEETREAIHVASWLHDCGKVTTPEHIVDKATKLETIHDRIHEVRMRVEVMKREAEIAFLRDVLAGRGDERRTAGLEAELAALDDDFAFVAQCNIGGEAMSDEAVARLERIARRTWTRTLDDRLGISQLERERMERTPPVPLPATERLLADKPEHVVERPEADRLAPDNRWGFRVDVPQHLYDRGELHNLSVRRGTLSEEDRYKINEHIVQTIKMLEALPFPRHLRAVPELAGGHHEKMDGTGYPRRLKGEDMSEVARMMAIADIFEALTAADRPYKKAKTLSEALKIMGFMVRDRHVDAALYDLFLTSGVWRAYAEAFLAPAQIDIDDIEPFRIRPAAA